MSFSSNVKNELMGSMPNARHCRIAELAAIVSIAGTLKEDGCLSVRSDSRPVLERAVLLIHKLCGTDLSDLIFSAKRSGKTAYSLEPDIDTSQHLCELVKADAELNINPMVLRQNCCKRAFLRGAFLASGSISDPEKDYHLEFVTSDDLRAASIADIISTFDIDAKTVHRKKYSVVYLKDGECIVDVLNIMEAHVSLMELENIRIVKEMRNTVNRRVNCEAANIDKTIKAAGRQIEDITYLRDTIGLDSLREDLRLTAQLRLENPELSLNELGLLHEKPVGRSGVNHRLQKLSDMAERLRQGKPLNDR